MISTALRLVRAGGQKRKRSEEEDHADDAEAGKMEEGLPFALPISTMLSEPAGPSG
jgi:hypothetical protein